MAGDIDGDVNPAAVKPEGATVESGIDAGVGDYITVAEYRKRYGNDPGDGGSAPPVVCPTCGQDVIARGGLTPTTVGHFAHRTGSGPCPTKEAGAVPYLDLMPAEPDPERGAWLRKQFVGHWDRYLPFLQACVLYLSPRELESMLVAARRRRLWDHRQLEPWQVPICLLVLTEFDPARSLPSASGAHGRSYWFRFWFDSTVRSLADLWIRRDGPATLLRGTYRPPAMRDRLPGLSELVRVLPAAVEPRLVENHRLRGDNALIGEFVAVLRKHLL